MNESATWWRAKIQTDRHLSAPLHPAPSQTRGVPHSPQCALWLGEVCVSPHRRALPLTQRPSPSTALRAAPPGMENFEFRAHPSGGLSPTKQQALLDSTNAAADSPADSWTIAAAGKPSRIPGPQPTTPADQALKKVGSGRSGWRRAGAQEGAEEPTAPTVIVPQGLFATTPLPTPSGSHREEALRSIESQVGGGRRLRGGAAPAGVAPLVPANRTDPRVCAHPPPSLAAGGQAVQGAQAAGRRCASGPPRPALLLGPGPSATAAHRCTPARPCRRHPCRQHRRP